MLTLPFKSAAGLLLLGGFCSIGFGVQAQESKAKRTGLLTYTVTMTGEASGATGEQKWTSKTNRMLKATVPLEFRNNFSVEADLKAGEEARARRLEAKTPAPAVPPTVPPIIAEAIDSCVKEGTAAGLMTCMQEGATRVCESATGADKESACVFARNLKTAQDAPVEPRSKPEPLARNGEIWHGQPCDLSTTMDDQTVGTRPYDPLTRGPYVSKSFTKANWSSQRTDKCAQITIDKIAKTIKLVLALPRDVKASIRHESPVQTSEETRTQAPFRDSGLPGRSSDSMEITADLTDLKSMSGSGTYTPPGAQGNSTVQTKLQWTVTFD